MLTSVRYSFCFQVSFTSHKSNRRQRKILFIAAKVRRMKMAKLKLKLDIVWKPKMQKWQRKCNRDTRTPSNVMTTSKRNAQLSTAATNEKKKKRKRNKRNEQYYFRWHVKRRKKRKKRTKNCITSVIFYVCNVLRPFCYCFTERNSLFCCRFYMMRNNFRVWKIFVTFHCCWLTFLLLLFLFFCFYCDKNHVCNRVRWRTQLMIVPRVNLHHFNDFNVFHFWHFDFFFFKTFFATHRIWVFSVISNEQRK